ncbi:hypothetical protein SAY87_030010 [Trapa incisa]|uniref:TIR domain-containing protein n=1 Tax=Trapa incisa TaxID=236973 RepID=A0AAN7KDT7_9MYRT|nr:hypothetical protein SAY87_030010 [Trapa incisa]
MLGHRIPHGKVLILLDDADRREQLSNLLPSLHKYAAGSRIIVTTRDRAVLEDFEVQHIHEVIGLREEDALVLLCKYAFKQDSPAAELADLSQEIVKATGGLPIAIEVIGSHLSSTREVDVWVEALQLLKNVKRIHQRLRISYDSLSDNAKKIFLDVACLFSGMDYGVPAHMWKPCELSPANVRRELCQRCLIKIGNDKKIWMHDLLKDLGREIVRQENEHPGGRTRLWRHSDAFDVLEMKQGTNKVEAIHLDIGVEDISDGGFNGKKFKKLTMLRFLDLGDINPFGNKKQPLRKLNGLSYHGNYPLNIPSDLHSTKLVVLDMSNSSITERWPGWTSTKVLENVEVLNLTSCHQLGRIPDFTPFKLMEKLILEDCLEIIKVEGSILSLTTLKSLSLKNCSKLRELPEDLSSLSNLEELIVDGTLIQEISISEGMESLTTLSAQRCSSLTQIPDSRNFMKLQQLLMSDYHHSVHGSSSSSRSNPMGYEYEVFLSFRGPDTRTKFTDHLYQRLVGASIDVFKDNMELPSGKEIGPQLLKGIENSKMYIVILSAGYARSKWCLEEAVNMVHCMDTADRLILPVFYHVTPHDVRHQTGDHYGPAFMEHENNHPWDTIDKWKVALSKIGKLKGWEIKDGNTGAEGEIVEEILNDVIKILDKFKLDVPHDYLVGIDDHVDEVRDMLAIEIADVRIVGICGMGGIGKTTIAKLVYNQLSYHFERCCFLENVREASSQSSGMKKLQSQLASDLFLRGQPEFDNTEKGKSKLRQRMPHEKVLILLDDADRREQLSNLLPSLHKYAAGSRIIVTTRDRAVLEDFEVQHIHEVTGLREEDALVLFCKYAFKQDSPAAELADLSREIVKATGGLPLAIEVIGSHLSSTREVDIWVEALQLLKNEKTIHQRLRISYDPLSDNAKKIFLDVACFFCGMDYRVPAHMWKSRELLPANVRRELCQRCLIKIGNDKKIWMHDLVKDLGREIVRLENEHAGERTRLWRHSDAFDVLEMELGTNKVEAIHLDIGVEDISHHGFDGNKFNNLTILRFLDLGNNNLVGNYKKRLLELNWLSYHGNYPLNIPSDLHSTKLVVLDLSNSSITERRPGWTPTKVP